MQIPVVLKRCLRESRVRRFNQLQSLLSGGGFQISKNCFPTSEREGETQGGGERKLLGRLEHFWNEIHFLWVHPHSSAVLMEPCLETHCFCHHISRWCFANTVPTSPYMLSPGKTQPEPTASETLPARLCRRRCEIQNLPTFLFKWKMGSVSEQQISLLVSVAPFMMCVCM